MQCHDPDAVVKVGAVNASLTNMKWYERLNGVRTLITSANKSYVITETGAEKGKIQVKKNTVPGSPVTLESTPSMSMRSVPDRRTSTVSAVLFAP